MATVARARRVRAETVVARQRQRHVAAAPLLAGALLSAIILAALAAPLLVPADPLAQDLAHRLEPPGRAYPLGSDSLGRDVLSRVLFGARTSLLVGFLAVLASGAFGTLLGVTAGYFGGWWDGMVMRVVDVWQAVPYLVLALGIAVVLGPGVETLVVVLALGTWTTFARVLRGETLTLRSTEEILAARVVGASSARILLRHVLVRLSGSLTVLGSLMLGSTILFEASLSFLGLGVQRPVPSWGNMLLDGVDVLSSAWWVSFFPGVAILLACLAVNVLGDWLRDALDPR